MSDQPAESNDVTDSPEAGAWSAGEPSSLDGARFMVLGDTGQPVLLLPG